MYSNHAGCMIDSEAITLGQWEDLEAILRHL
jgi:hypothetical protein